MFSNAAVINSTDNNLNHINSDDIIISVAIQCKSISVYYNYFH